MHDDKQKANSRKSAPTRTTREPKSELASTRTSGQPEAELAPTRTARNATKPASKPDHRKQLGNFGEQVAADYLLQRGYTILHRNWRRRGGELDIVARDGAALVFVEVRTRSTRTHGSAEESVDWRKQRQVRKIAAQYLTEQQLDAFCRDLRFDVITVYVDRSTQRIRTVQHLPHAF
jgi:putative endonuclease